MWLGLTALLVAFGYAIVKFLTSLHMRRLRDLHFRLLNEVKKERQRVQAVDGKLQIQRAKRGEVQQKLTNARRFKDDLFGRLRLELPSTLMAELRQCVNRHPIPEPDGVRTAHDLRLADKVTAALTQLSLVVVEFSAEDEDDGAVTVLAGELVKRLTAAGARFTGPETRRGEPEGSPQVLTTAFDEPGTALDTLAALGATHADSIHVLRAVLVAGISITEFDQEHVNRLFARTLHSTRQLLESAAPGALILNERAQQLLGQRPEVVPVEDSDNLWMVALGAAAQEVAAAPAAQTSSAQTPPEPAAAAPPDPDAGTPAPPSATPPEAAEGKP